MGSGHRGVHADLPGDQPFGVGSGRQGGEDLAPGAVALPAAKQPVHRLPRPVAGRHIPPRRPGPGPPADPIDQLPLAPGGWPAGLLAGGQQRLQPGPLFVGEVASSPARSISRGISTFETGPSVPTSVGVDGLGHGASWARPAGLRSLPAKQHAPKARPLPATDCGRCPAAGSRSAPSRLEVGPASAAA